MEGKDNDNNCAVGGSNDDCDAAKDNCDNDDDDDDKSYYGDGAEEDESNGGTEDGDEILKFLIFNHWFTDGIFITSLLKTLIFSRLNQAHPIPVTAPATPLRYSPLMMSLS